jgi:HemY protein
MLVSKQRFTEAKPLLEEMQGRHRRHPQVLSMLAACYRELGEWDALLKLLPTMQKAGAIDDEQAAELRQQAVIAGLDGSRDSADLEARFRALPRQTQRLSEVAGAFAEQALRLDAPELNEEVIRNSLKVTWEPSLLIPYGEPGPDDTSKRLKQCEKWLQQHTGDAGLHLALGRLCAGESLWGKAREHMVKSLELEPSSLGYDAFGQLLERQGELEPAMACFRNALRMSQGQTPKPLPTSTVRLSAPRTPVEPA